MTGCQESRVSVKGVQFLVGVFRVFFNTAHLPAELCCSLYPVDTQLKEHPSELDVILKHPFLKRHTFAI